MPKRYFSPANGWPHRSFRNRIVGSLELRNAGRGSDRQTPASSRQAQMGGRLCSVAPKILEAGRAQRRVFGGVLDRHMAKPVLDRPGIDASIGQRVAAAVPQHVEMHRQR